MQLILILEPEHLALEMNISGGIIPGMTLCFNYQNKHIYWGVEVTRRPCRIKYIEVQGGQYLVPCTLKAGDLQEKPTVEELMHKYGWRPLYHQEKAAHLGV